MTLLGKSAIRRVCDTVAASYAASYFMASNAWAAFNLPSAPSGTEDPTKKGAETLLSWANSGAGLITAAATLAGVVVIGLAVFNKMNWGWAGKIVAALLALTGLSWIIDSIVS